jgi:tetratricopeptide (TPR) repeat protein
LLGRQRERDVLERLLEGARDGHGGVLVVLGEPGVGKTALLEYAIEAGAPAGVEFRVVRTDGVRGGDGAPVCGAPAAVLTDAGSLERLPEPQRDALSVAFGLSAGQAPDPFLVGLAVLGLFSEAAQERPLLALVDDAQWLDRASARALAFVGRRLLAEHVAIAFATRETGETLAGLPEVEVEQLGRRDARALLESVLPGRMDEAVLERLIAETRGNPLALLELPRGLSPAQLAGGFGPPDAMPLSERIEESFARRFARLPRKARLLALVAAAEPAGDPALVWRAARLLGVPESAVHTVEGEGLLTLRPAVVFRHPLVRSAVYHGADPDERREGPPRARGRDRSGARPDRCAWHRAQAAAVPDEGVASDLERSAERAQARGGFAAAAAFLELAASLTPEPTRRAERALAAAQTKFRAGAVEDALRLLATAEGGVLSDLERARVGLLRAQIAFVSTHGSDAPAMLLATARRFETLSPTVACETYLEAMLAAMFAGRLAAPGASALDVALAVKARMRPPVLAGLELWLDGLATLFTDGYEAAVPILRRANSGFDTGDMPASEQVRWKGLATVLSIHMWDDVRWQAIAGSHVRIAREAGALGELPVALTQRVYAHLFAGELAAAALLVDEIRAATEATGNDLAPYGAAGLLALRGREPEALSLIDESRRDVTQRGEGIGLSMLDWAQAVLSNGLGRYEEACAAALRVVEHPEDLSSSNWGMVELIEAAARVGNPGLAQETLKRLDERTRVADTDWALGVAARSTALCVDDERAEELHLEAIDRLGRTRMAVDLVRAHLLYGEWLRRQRRRVDAREELRVAYDRFSDFGMEAFAERARVELEATGGARSQTGARHARSADAAGGAGVSTRSAGEDQSGDRRAAVHQPQHGRVPPAESVPQAGREVTYAARAASDLSLTGRSAHE